MATNESDLVKRLQEAPVNYALLKLIHHEVGNGLAVLSGYRHLLQHALLAQVQEPFPPTQDIWHKRNERWLGYLQTMHDREMRLHNLLVQLRELSPGTTAETLGQNYVRTDLAVLLGRVMEQRTLLYPEHLLQASMPAQALFIMCDPFWLEVLFEHILNHTVVTYPASTLTEIHLEPFPRRMSKEAKITFRLKRELPGRTPGRGKEHEVQLRALEQGESDVCLALCHEILHEHGGQIWSEQEGSIVLSFPLAERESVEQIDTHKRGE